MAYARPGDYLENHGQDPRPILAKSREAAEACLRLRPGSASAYNCLGFGWWREAEYEKGKGLDPHASAQNGIAAFTRAMQADPGDSVPCSYAGALHRSLAAFEGSHGGDPRPELDRAMDPLQRAVALNPKSVGAFNNLAGIPFTRGNTRLSTGPIPPRPSWPPSPATRPAWPSIQTWPSPQQPRIGLQEFGLLQDPLRASLGRGHGSRPRGAASSVGAQSGLRIRAVQPRHGAAGQGGKTDGAGCP